MLFIAFDTFDKWKITLIIALNLVHLDPFLDHKKLSTFYMSPVVELGSVQHIIFMSKFLHWRPAISPAGSTVIHSHFTNCAEV